MASVRPSVVQRPSVAESTLRASVQCFEHTSGSGVLERRSKSSSADSLFSMGIVPSASVGGRADEDRGIMEGGSSGDCAVSTARASTARTSTARMSGMTTPRSDGPRRGPSLRGVSGMTTPRSDGPRPSEAASVPVPAVAAVSQNFFGMGPGRGSAGGVFLRNEDTRFPVAFRGEEVFRGEETLSWRSARPESLSSAQVMRGAGVSSELAATGRGAETVLNELGCEPDLQLDEGPLAAAGRAELRNAEPVLATGRAETTPASLDVHDSSPGITSSFDAVVRAIQTEPFYRSSLDPFTGRPFQTEPFTGQTEMETGRPLNNQGNQGLLVLLPPPTDDVAMDDTASISRQSSSSPSSSVENQASPSSGSRTLVGTARSSRSQESRPSLLPNFLPILAIDSRPTEYDLLVVPEEHPSLPPERDYSEGGTNGCSHLLRNTTNSGHELPPRRLSSPLLHSPPLGGGSSSACSGRPSTLLLATVPETLSSPDEGAASQEPPSSRSTRVSPRSNRRSRGRAGTEGTDEDGRVPRRVQLSDEPEVAEWRESPFLPTDGAELSADEEFEAFLLPEGAAGYRKLAERSSYRKAGGVTKGRAFVDGLLFLLLFVVVMAVITIAAFACKGAVDPTAVREKGSEPRGSL